MPTLPHPEEFARLQRSKRFIEECVKTCDIDNVEKKTFGRLHLINENPSQITGMLLPLDDVMPVYQILTPQRCSGFETAHWKHYIPHVHEHIPHHYSLLNTSALRHYDHDEAFNYDDFDQPSDNYYVCGYEKMSEAEGLRIEIMHAVGKQYNVSKKQNEFLHTFRLEINGDCYNPEASGLSLENRAKKMQEVFRELFTQGKLDYK